MVPRSHRLPPSLRGAKAVKVILGAQAVFNRIWEHFVLEHGCPARGWDGRLLPEYMAAYDFMPPTGSACSLFFRRDVPLSYLVGQSTREWARAAVIGTPMDANAASLVETAERVVREGLKASLRDQVIDGGLFVTEIQTRLEAIRVDFRLAEYSPPVPQTAPKV